MDAQDVGAGVHPLPDCRKRSGKARPRRPLRDRADEVLARHGQQQRPLEIVQARRARAEPRPSAPASCRNRGPGRASAARKRCRAPSPPTIRSRRNRLTSAPTSPSSVGSRSFSFGAARVCISTSAAPVPAHTSASSGSRSPLTSLTIAAPAAIAACATAGLYVSTDTTAPSSRVTRSISGTTRSISSSGATGGRFVTPDSPPMSMMSAPASSSDRASSTRSSSVRSPPASENESGRGVDDAHQPRPTAELERARCREQGERRRGHTSYIVVHRPEGIRARTPGA